MRNRRGLSIVAILTILFVLSALKSLPSPAYGLEVIDQKQELSDGGSDSIAYYSPCGQEFVPSLSNLAAVEVYLEFWEDIPAPATLSLSIRESAITGTEIGQLSQDLMGDELWSGWVRFQFSSSLTVSPGGTYVIRLETTSNVMGWGTSSSNLYASGRSVRYYGDPTNDYLFGTNDFAFRTYAEISAPYYDIEQNGVPVTTLNIPVGSTFTVDAWIRNSPSVGLEGFLLIVFWDSTMMELTGHQNAGNTYNWGQWEVGVYGYHINFQGGSSGGSYITSDMVYLTLTFRCLSQGTSQISMGDGYLDIAGQEQNVLPPDSIVTCNQLSPTTSNPYHYVGGELFSANKAVITAPYLIGIFTILAVVAFRLKKRKN